MQPRTMVPAGGFPIGNSLTSGGISQNGNSSKPVVVSTSLGPVVAWIDQSSPLAQVYAKVFTAGEWKPLGTGSTTGGGLTQSTNDVNEFAISSNGSLVAVTWSARTEETSHVYLREFNGTLWSELAGSASGNGISGDGDALARSVAYLGNTLFIAWQERHQQTWQIHGVRQAGSSWLSAGPAADSGLGISNTPGDAVAPQLSAGDGVLHLAWREELRESGEGLQQAIYARTWSGSQFWNGCQATRATSVSIVGMHQIGLFVLATDETGQPAIAWEGSSLGTAQIFVRGDRRLESGNDFMANASNTTQQILDSEDLGPGDVIFITSPQTSFQVGSDDSGVTIIGSADATVGSVTIENASDVTLQRLSIESLTSTDATRLSVAESDVTVLNLSRGSGLQLLSNQIESLHVSGGIGGSTFANNFVETFLLESGGARTTSN